MQWISVYHGLGARNWYTHISHENSPISTKILKPIETRVKTTVQRWWWNIVNTCHAPLSGSTQLFSFGKVLLVRVHVDKMCTAPGSSLVKEAE